LIVHIPVILKVHSGWFSSTSLFQIFLPLTKVFTCVLSWSILPWWVRWVLTLVNRSSRLTYGSSIGG